MTTAFQSTRKYLAVLEDVRPLEVAVMICVLLFGALLEIFGIGLVFPLIQSVQDPTFIDDTRVLRQAKEMIGYSDNVGFLTLMAVLIVVSFVLKNLFSVFRNYWQAHFLYRHQAAMADKLFDHYLNAPYEYHLQRDSTDLITLLNVIVPKVFNQCLKAILEISTEGLLVAGVVLLLIVVDPVTSVAAIGINVVMGLLLEKVYRGWIRAKGQRSTELEQSVFRTARDGLATLKDIRVLGRSRFFTETYEKTMNQRVGVEAAIQGYSAMPRAVFEVVLVVFVSTFLIVAVKNDESVSEVIAFLGLFGVAAMRLIPSANKLVLSISALHLSGFARDLLFAELSALKEVKVVASGAAADSRKPLAIHRAIEFSNVDYHYAGAETASLDGVSLTVERGQFVALVGPSGAGKTTLVHILLGLLEPQSGNVSVDGRDVFDDLSAWHGSIGFVPQRITLLNDTLRRNVAFALPDDLIDDARVREVLAVANLTEVVKGLPQGLDTPLGDEGVRLSGGQIQRVGIARALYHDPDLIVLDEATSAMDAISEKEIADAIAGLKGYKTVVVIAHRLSTVRMCDRLYYLQAGRIAGAGGFDELAQSVPDFSRMIEISNLQASGH